MHGSWQPRVMQDLCNNLPLSMLLCCLKHMATLTLAAMMLFCCARFPVSRLLLAPSTAAIGACMVLGAVHCPELRCQAEITALGFVY